MTYRAITHVQHSGRLFPAGDYVQGLTEEEAKRLLELQAIEAVELPGGDGPASLSGPDTPPAPQDSELTLAELTAHLADDPFVEDVQELLQKELARKPEPRKGAVKILQEWLKEAEADELQGTGAAGQSNDVSQS